jgi:hypothetical protein
MCAIRRGYKAFGLIDCFPGWFFYQASDGKFTRATYEAFLRTVLRQTCRRLYAVQDGAK